MTDVHAEMARALDDVRKTLLSIVAAGQIDRPNGVHLTWVGGEFAREKNAPFQQYISFLAISAKLDIPAGQRTMAGFIAGCCSDILKLEQHPNGTVIVRRITASVEPPGTTETAAISPHGATTLRRFRPGIWVAFIRPLTLGYRRYVNPKKTAFNDLDGPAPGDDWTEVAREYVLGIPQDHQVDGLLVQNRIAKWAADTGLNIGDLIAETEADHTRRTPSLDDLAEIVKCLPPDLAARWMIPADVLRYLRRR